MDTLAIACKNVPPSTQPFYPFDTSEGNCTAADGEASSTERYALLTRLLREQQQLDTQSSDRSQLCAVEAFSDYHDRYDDRLLLRAKSIESYYPPRRHKQDSNTRLRSI